MHETSHFRRQARLVCLASFVGVLCSLSLLEAVEQHHLNAMVCSAAAQRNVHRWYEKGGNLILRKRSSFRTNPSKHGAGLF